MLRVAVLNCILLIATTAVGDDRHWAYRPVKRHPVPTVAHSHWPRNPIDNFVLSKLEARRWKPAADVSRRVLLRRVFLNLAGVPPTLAEQRRFQNDRSPNAFEKVVDDLLARPDYGERWGRHWLDLVRFAETNGYERDAIKPHAWRYRDYVIDALNADKPYDRFVLEQLAGDELPDRSTETVIATGYHRLGPWDDEPADPRQDRFDQLDDLVRTTSRAFLGITLGCARCHDHKFDELTMLDYYRMVAVFAPLQRPRNGRSELDLPAGSYRQLSVVAERDRKIRQTEKEMMALRSSFKTAYLRSGKSTLSVGAIAAFLTPVAKQSTKQKELVRKHAKHLAGEVDRAIPGALRSKIAGLQQRIAELKRRTPDLPRGYFLREPSPNAPQTHLLKRGRAASPVRPRTSADQPKAKDSRLLFETDILPILKRNCVRCHSPRKRKGELDLTSFVALSKGSESGPVVSAGNLKESRLFEVVADGEMPPGKKNRLKPAEVAVIRKWIKSGARSKYATKTPRRVTQHQVIPILLLRCTVCHGGRRKEAGLDLRTVAGMLKGGKSGPAIVRGKPKSSLLLKRIHAGDMPPRRKLVSVSVKPMEAGEIRLLETWIRQGARTSKAPVDVATTKSDPLVTDEDRRFWSFQPPKAVAVPSVQNRAQIRNPVDAFLLRRLEANGLTFSREVRRAALLRRVTIDLTGLPPSPDDVLRFLADDDPLAYEKAVDRLLASPRYGERWARHWLDVAGYADSEGAQNQDRLRKHIWRYRDYVVQAFNADKPYDRFLHEQLAGDELADCESAKTITREMYDNLAATGFLRTAPDRTFANITNFVPDRLEVIADEIQIVGTAVLGLTLQCARCHSHKFDPIPQRDYYRLKAIFQDAWDEHDWLKSQGPRTLPLVSTQERSAWQKEIDRIAGDTKTLQERLAVAEKLSRQKLPAKPQGGKPVSVAELKKRDATYRKLVDETAKKIKALKDSRPSEPRIRALWSRGTPSPTYLLRRGDYLKPAQRVGPGVPSALTDGRTPFVVRKPWPGAKKTGRRLAFAKWLTQPRHPLTARVMVNRIWRHHFGRGLVTTPDNFGKAGARPSHPELLDWLAVEFVRNGWSVKHLHRLMVTSSAYRQSSSVRRLSLRERASFRGAKGDNDPQSRDPGNALLSRMPLHRMEAEVLRDSLLSVAGELNDRPFGTPDAVSRRSDGLVTSVRSARGWRRSIYVRQRRTTIPTLLENFDSPQMGPNCVKRSVSIVAPQALSLMNGKFTHDLARSFAARVEREAGDKPDAQIRRIYLIAYARPPNRQELRVARKALNELAKRWKSTDPKTTNEAAARRALENFCHAVMNSAEFLFLD